MLQQMQQQMQQLAAENAALQARVQAAEERAAQRGPGGGMDPGDVLQALRDLPEALSKLNKPKGLIDPKGLGKPSILNEEPEQKFRLWSVKLEDYVTGVFGGKSREALEWAAGSDAEITQGEIENAYGTHADANDQWDEIDEFDKQLYTVLRATTDGVPFTVVGNVATGRGLEAWRHLRRKYDPSTGGRKRTMLAALTSPERASFENLGGALERWKALKHRYEQKKDQFGVREALPESLAMNSLERLVPKELETHLMLNYTRFRTFDDMEKEVVNYMEAKTGNKLALSSNFSKAQSSEVTPMEIDSLVRAVSGTISSLVGGKGKGSNKIPEFDGKCDNCGKTGHKKKDCWPKAVVLLEEAKAKVLHRGHRVQAHKRGRLLSSKGTVTIVANMVTRRRTVGARARTPQGKGRERLL